MVGVTFGLCIRMLLYSFQIAGGLVSQMSGWPMPSGSPSGDSTQEAPLARLLDLMSLAILLAIGGHRQLMTAFLEGFRLIPIGVGEVSADMLSVVGGIVQHSLHMGLRIAAPLVASTLLAGIVVALFQRTMPRLGAMASTIGWAPLAAIATLLVSLGGMAVCFEQPWNEQLTRLVAVWSENNGSPPGSDRP